MRPRLFLLLMALLAAGSLGLRCASNSERAALDEPLTPPGTVEREPYLIAMTDSSAVIRWSTFQPAEPGIRFWSGADTTQLVLTQRGREHSFAMTNLQPATTYTYQIQINDTLWSQSADFRTFPTIGSKDPFTYLIIGDSGTLSAAQLALAVKFNQEEAALVLHVGDLAYQNGRAIDFTVKVFGVYAPLFKRVPIFPAAGGHDFRTRLGEPYAEAFTPPGGHPSDSAFYYAFTYGNVRFISLDSEDTEAHARAYGYLGDPTSRQYQWLLVELSAARQDPRLDWTVVYLHHPPYSASTGFGGHGSQLPMRRALSPLMDSYGVLLVYTGHDHDFQRSRPLRGNTVVNDGEGTVYYVTGGGGGRTAFRGTGADWFTAASEQTFHYLRAKVDHYTMTIEAVNTAGQVFDTYAVTIPEDQRKLPLLPAEPVPFDDEADPAATPPAETPAVEATGAR